MSVLLFCKKNVEFRFIKKEFNELKLEGKNWTNRVYLSEKGGVFSIPYLSWIPI